MDFLSKPKPPSLSTKDRQMNILSEKDPLTKSQTPDFQNPIP